MTMTVLYCLTLGAAITDILKSRIFNRWLLVCGILGLIINIIDSKTPGSIAGTIIKALLITLLLTPVYLIKGIGGGDIKLFAAISVFLPLGEMMVCLLMAFIIGALFGIIKIVVTKNLHQTIHFAIPILISTLLVTGNGSLICM